MSSNQWYYSHADVTRGPFSEEEIKDHAARKLLLKTDLIWPEGREPKDAAPAAVVVDFPSATSASAPIPDWLADVAAADKVGPAPEPTPSHDAPEWLEDLRLWLGLEVYVPAAPSAENKPGQTGEIPDWLAGWMTPEQPKQAPPPAPVLPTAPPIAPPVAIPVAIPVKIPAVSAPAAPPVAVAPRAPAPVDAKPPAEKRANPLVENIRQASGFDLETGQILDAAKFEKWKQNQAHTPTASQPAVSNASLIEVFRKGRLAIETWVDADKNRRYVMDLAVEEIKSNPEVQTILHGYANYGQQLQDKLLKHLEFMVENRRKYYKAIEKLRR